MVSFIKPNTNIKFMANRYLFMTISLILVVISLVFIFTKGLSYGIDFTGGVEVQIKFEEGRNIDISEIRKVVNSLNLGSVQVQNFEDTNDFLIRIEGEKEGLNQTSKEIEAAISKNFGNYELRKVDLVGPRVGEELRQRGFYSILYALIGILIYIALRFDYKFSPGAVLSLIHDLIITMGIFSIFKLPFTLSTIAALLTIVGYSLNDTIVVYDRIRETMGDLKGVVLSGVIDRAINDTLSRTILTSFTTLLVVAMLVIFGGGAIQDFAIALFIGVVVGTYSSIFIAAPILLDIDRMTDKKAKNV